jgi:excisionase family DNA binding protein
MRKVYPVVPQLLTVSQTAELLCVSRQTVYAYIYKQGLPSISVGGIRRIHPDSLMRWLAEREKTNKL